MITFIASFPHLYTFTALSGEVLGPSMPPTGAITYDQLFAATALVPGTYVFTDMERLHPAELRLAAAFYRAMGRLAGFRVLNDPAKVRTRHALLRALAEAGLNDFDSYPADALPRPKRFPVFLRIASDHAGPIGDLIDDQAELDARLAALADEGVPLTGMLVVEFCGERGIGGLYEKLAFLRVGDRITLSAMLANRHWNVKDVSQSMDFATPETMRYQLAALLEDRFAQSMRAAFDIAGIDYGRADVGFGNGRLQVYEINTNPSIKASNTFTSDEHRRARMAFRDRLSAMMHAADSPAGQASVPIDLGTLDAPSEFRRARARTILAGERAEQAEKAAAAAAEAAAVEAMIVETIAAETVATETMVAETTVQQDDISSPVQPEPFEAPPLVSARPRGLGARLLRAIRLG